MKALFRFLALIIALFAIGLHLFDKSTDTEATYMLVIAIWLWITNQN